MNLSELAWDSTKEGERTAYAGVLSFVPLHFPFIQPEWLYQSSLQAYLVRE